MIFLRRIAPCKGGGRGGGVRFFWSSASGCGVYWPVDSLNASSPFSDLTVVLRNLRGALGLWCTRGVLGHALALILHARLAGVGLRMERLVARFAAGRLWRVAGRVRGVVPDGGAARGLGRVWIARVWPGRFAWLVRMAGWQAAGFGSQLRAVLQTPEMVALLEASPQAGRMLRPICRMLAVEISLLRIPVAVAVAVAAVPVAAEVVVADVVAGVGGGVRKRVRGVMDFGRIPLPRGVLAAARRQGYGRVVLVKAD